MGRHRPWVVAVLIALAPVQPERAAGAATTDDIAIIVGATSSMAALRAEQIRAYFTGSSRGGPDGVDVFAFNLVPGDPVRSLFERVVLGMSAEQVARFWVDQRIRGGRMPPRQAPNSQLVVRLVARLPGALGYVPASALDGSVRVVARIRNGKIEPP